MYLILDTETTGVAPTAHFVSISWAVYDESAAELSLAHHIIYPDGFTIPVEASAIHGNSTEAARRTAIPIKTALAGLSNDIEHHEDRLYPDELEPAATYFEGARKLVRVNAFERDHRARDACLAHYGFLCSVCGADFAKTYGPVGKHFIHVHHLKPIALTDAEYELDPIADLRPVCPNCHAMLHRPERLLTIDELKQRIKAAQRTGAGTSFVN